MNPFTALAISIISILFLSAAIRKLAERAFPPRLLLVLFFPGVVFHEIFHAIASLLVGSKIHKINFFSLSGGSVLHEKPRLPFGQFLISFAPFLGGMALISLAGAKIFAVPDVSGLSQVLFAFPRVFLDHFTSLWFWVFLYTVYSVSVTMLPSWQDVKNSITSLVLTALVLVVVFESGFLDPNATIFQRLNRMLFVPLSLLASLFVISGVFCAVKKFCNIK